MYIRNEYQNHQYIRWTHTFEDRQFDSLKTVMHYDRSFILTYLVRGTGRLLVEGRAYPIFSGDVLILNPGEFHCCHLDECDGHERISVYIDEGLASSVGAGKKLYAAFTDRVSGEGNVIPAKTVQALHIDQILRNIAEKNGGDSEEDYQLGLSCLCVQLLLQLKKVGILGSEQSAVTKDMRVLSVIDYINEHLMEELSVSMIADEFFLDRSYLCRIFKRATGITVGRYIEGKRVDRVMDMLSCGVGCTEACFLCGFGNYSSFYKILKKHTGSAPREHKK